MELDPRSWLQVRTSLRPDAVPPGWHALQPTSRCRDRLAQPFPSFETEARVPFMGTYNRFQTYRSIRRSRGRTFHGSKTVARFTSQHHGMNGPSTLANSILSNPQLVAGLLSADRRQDNIAVLSRRVSSHEDGNLASISAVPYLSRARQGRAGAFLRQRSLCRPASQDRRTEERDTCSLRLLAPVC
jgi:hypothetical protein